MGDLVTAVMITGLPARKKLATAALAAYKQQTHHHRELLIVDDGPEPLLSKDTQDIKTIRVPPGKTLGELRNVALSHAQGDWIIQADDDDWYHHDRFRYQLSNTLPGRASLLRCQVRYSFDDGQMVLWTWSGPCPGIPGTILHPNEPGLRYRSEPRDEDTHFVSDHFKGRIIVAENVTFPECYIRFYHGKNTWSRQHVMGTEQRQPGSAAVAYLQQVVSRFYKDVATDLPMPV